MLLAYADQEAERFEPTATIALGSSLRLGGLDRHAIAVPGHAMDALALHAPEAKLLVFGDVLREKGFGLVLPRTSAALDAAERSLQRLGQLEVALLMPGHGDVFSDYAGALERTQA